MLSAEYLAGLSDDIVYLYAQLESDIKRAMFTRIARLKAVTDATVYEAEKLKAISTLHSDIERMARRTQKKAESELVKLFDEALEKAKEQDLKYYEMGKRSLSEEQRQVMGASLARFDDAERINKTYAAISNKRVETFAELTRMTLTVADSSEQAFIRAVNRAYMGTASGAFSWQKAYKTAVNETATAKFNAAQAVGELSHDGLYVTYNYSGKTVRRSLEAAARMNVLTGVNQTASEQTIINCSELGASLVEVSAHMGARPEHAAFQGRVFSLNGDATYTDENGQRRTAPDFYRECRLGEADGICGINCRHSYYPYFPGTPRLYTNGKLDEMNGNKVRVDGKEVTQYEAEQMLRNCESNIRRYKSAVQGYELTGETDAPQYMRAKRALGSWQARAREITAESGLNRKYINEYIGTPNGRPQPRGINPE